MRVIEPKAVLTVFLLLVGLGACTSEMPDAAPVLRPVRYQRVTVEGLETSRTLVGVVKAGIEADLSFRVGGTVIEVEVTLGDSVRKGDVLARLDGVDYELEVQQADAGLAQAAAAVRKSEADFDRTRALYENNNASKSELDAARAAAESARSQVDAATRRLQLTRQQLAYTVLRAPIDGAIALKDIEINESVKAGDPVFMMTSGSRAKVEFAVPGVMIAEVDVGLPVVVSIDALPGREFPAEITEVGVAALGVSAAFGSTARLLEEVPEAKSGMAAEVAWRFKATGSEGNLAVPWVAVGEDRDGRFVFVLEPESEGVGTVHRRAVTVGAIGQSIEILEGIEAGDLVVTAGTRRLADGMRVKMDDETGGDG